MALMTFEIPDGMTAQVIIGPPEAHIRREQLQLASETAGTEARSKPRRRWFLMSTGAVGLLVAGMVLGVSLKFHTPAKAETVALSQPTIPTPDQGPPPATTAFPLQAPPAPALPATPPVGFAGSDAPAPAAPPLPASEQVPPAFTADLKVPPEVEPAPGQAPAPAPGRAPGYGGTPTSPQNAFGLGG